MQDNIFTFHGTQNIGTFSFKGLQYQYFNHAYNGVGINERTIELPIAYHYLNKYKNKDILEVGNVMGHYIPIEIKRDIVDKYEIENDVINIDIMDYCPNKKYDFILSVSTMEHIGNGGQEILNPSKGIDAINKLQNMLKPNGLFLCTFPAGVNYHLDYGIKDGKIKFDELYCFARESTTINHWHFSKFDTAFESPTKGVQMPIKATDGNFYDTGIYFFLFICFKYGGTNE